MRQISGTLSLCLALFGTQVFADPKPVVVLELFTSQGCSSCPPADHLLGELVEDNDDVLALSFHVDYWDYIGWTDTFADPDHGLRQKTYARNFHERMVYTPQMVVQGQAGMVGHKKQKIEDAIDAIRSAPVRATLHLTKNGDMLSVAMTPLDGPVGKSDVYVVRFKPEAVVQIGRGENSGKRMTYTNVVMSSHVVDMWDGDAPKEITFPLMGRLPAAVLLQEHGQGDVLAAAALR